ncbi:hypothetical protein [uncultured Aquimarina sp.]|uniref:hypothetical protein n=1 Tax=uncultured Aquimarina sp. TaxID=575652 RepID=UPI0026269936|nr:hypothetical protein [uncultured Aquimarina sp.]
MIVVLLFELSYRFSIIDFYKGEFEALNETKDIESKDVDYLVFGDSFSAAGNNYVDYLRQSKDKTFINSSIPGIGIKQVNTFIHRRLKKYTPKNIIYQVYVGNDLTDVNHLTNYKKISFARNVYWDMSDIILSSSYINARLGGFKSVKRKTGFNILKESFSIDNYNPRSKLYFKSDPEYLYKSVVIEGDFKNRYAIWIREVEKFITEIPLDTNVYIVFIPHCAQLNSFYYNNLKQIGATFLEEDEFNRTYYGFFKKASLDLKSYKNVSLVNPLEKLRESDSLHYRLYYENDPHLNDLGQKVLGNYLKKQLLLNK